ncbi:uncharacterized protein N7446_005613 [Penicillium canescens]|uniref:tryptophan synthase n=1 Tax=Penicillium canescens TaxID=5083 RepID=A0AAD6NBG0_PENCN|nr:uncharacterized protein N7446_005613 [Penicillium canescens]KAJ6050144.1 hypothetical protein N7444_006860 [Penicillium canescens]KAJ6050985.1 hypothetical protein N7460_001519 [Penicillium canescens]KAJ6061493.1 hypothetical protein N7446_005613 [Penicillium canescens]
MDQCQSSYEDKIIISGRFGGFGGRYAPESQIEFLQNLTTLFQNSLDEVEFWNEYWTFLPNEPSPLHRAPALTQLAGGGDVWLKREDLNGYTSPSRYNIVGQILLARRMNKTEIITACTSMYHGIECATLCATLGMACSIYMGAKDALSGHAEIQEMKRMGATVIIVNKGNMSLREARGEALQSSTVRFKIAFYVSISDIGPHPYPWIVRTFQSIIGSQAMSQLGESCGKFPTWVAAPITGNGTAVGFFYPFSRYSSVKLLAVEAFGAAALCFGSHGVYSGAFTNVIQNDDGQILQIDTLSPEMNSPASGPELSRWKQDGQLKCAFATREEALEGQRILEDTEGIPAGLDTAHAIQNVINTAQKLDNDEFILVLVSGP